jgi:hypothetical protein
MMLAAYPGHLIALALLALGVVLLALAYRSAAARKTRWLRWLLGALQYAAAALVLVIIWDPSRLRMAQGEARNTVLVFFDTSQSMSVGDTTEASKLDQAVELFEQHFARAGTKRPEYRIFGFDQYCYNTGSVRSLRKWGHRTDMHKLVSALGKYGSPPSEHESAGVLDEGRTVGAVVFTDGQADDKNVESYFPRREGEMSILLVGMGSPETRSDVGVKSIKAPARAALNSAYKVEVEVQSKGEVAGQAVPVTLELLKDDYVISVREVAAEQLKRGGTVEFSVGADTLGTHRLAARLTGVEDELNTANNVRRALVQVEEAGQLRVLLYSQVASSDIGKIRSALERDKKINLDFGYNTIISPAKVRKIKDVSGHTPLPTDREGFYRYDIIILGPCAFDDLTPEQIDGLYSFVTGRGGGLIFLPGRDNYDPRTSRNPQIQTLLPATPGRAFSSSPSRWQIPKLTGEGLESKILLPEDLRTRQAFAAPHYVGLQKKPAASALLNTREHPLVYIQRVGRGQVCLVNMAQLFRWYREDMRGGLLQKLFSGLATRMGHAPQLAARLELFAKRSATDLKTAVFDAYVYDNNFELVNGAIVLLEVGGELKGMDQVDRGHYSLEIGHLSGEAIIARAEAEIGGVFLGEKTLVANLPLPEGEMDRVELDREFLQELGKRIGGQYVDAAKVDRQTSAVFPATTRTEKVSHTESVWPCWPLLLSLCTLLTANWFIRRAAGLV